MSGNFEEDDEDCEPQCFRCHDSGLIPAADGFHELLGYNYVPCDCPAGTKHLGTLAPAQPPWEC